jgi:3-oxocholest-4-en-26-oate---CoA ligase
MVGHGLNLASAFRGLAEADPDRGCLVFRDQEFARADVLDRASRIAGILRGADLGCHAERSALAPWERGQSVVALMLYNGNEYLESMLGSYAARCAPANINWRATADELTYLLTDSGAEALIYHRSLAATVATAIAAVAHDVLLLEVDDGRGDVTNVGRGAQPYEDALADSSPCWIDGSPDDLYVLYTGGTTGRPKGTLWRQADFVRGALGVRHETVERVLAAAAQAPGRLRSLAAPPLIHGAAQWNSWSTWLAGGTVIFPSDVHRFSAVDVLQTIERSRATALQIVGDAFGRPLLDALRGAPFDLGSLRVITSGGTALSPDVRAGLQAALPGVTVLDIVGSSEAGRLAVASHDASGSSGFVPSGSTTVITDTRDALLVPSDDAVGWLATAGAIPLGYLGDKAKTEATFPIIDGVRYVVPGDRARWRVDGSIDILGREAAVINTGGEKVFAEEVEAALISHPAVDDALVVGCPHPTLGSEVCAVVATRHPVGADELRDHVAQTLSRYKLPRRIVFADAVERSPAGKPDYPWARGRLDGNEGT